MIDAAKRALGTALAMGWEIIWPLIIGFAPSAVVQAVVSRRHMSPTMHRCRREIIGFQAGENNCPSDLLQALFLPENSSVFITG
jgi:hypothetical protein